MTISIITPTHSPRWLKRAWESLKGQTFSKFEWVIVPNGDADHLTSPALLDLPNDPRIRVVPYAGANRNIGAIKKFAFDQGATPILVELDHDDELAPNALEEIVKAFDAHPDVGFVYSDFIDVSDDGKPVTYHGNRPEWEKNGWRFYTAPMHDIRHLAARAFEPSAVALSLVYYAPNHVRAWRAEVYRELGGHDANYAFCDDHELLIRTYLKTRMLRIPRPLYLYHVTGSNTWAEREKEIRRITYDLQMRNLHALVLRECELRSLPCLDLGGAFNSPLYWIPVDCEFPAQTAQDASITVGKGASIVVAGNAKTIINGREVIVVDLLKYPWPFADGSVGAFRAYDFLEHLPNKAATMREIHRCLAPGGYLLSATPSTDGRGAWQDPTHVSYWNENAFWYWTRRDQARFIKNETDGFKEVRLYTGYPNPWAAANNVPYAIADLVKLGREETPGINRF